MCWTLFQLARMVSCAQDIYRAIRYSFVTFPKAVNSSFYPCQPACITSSDITALFRSLHCTRLTLRGGYPFAQVTIHVPPPSIIYKPSQKPRNLRRVAAKNGSTFAKQAQNAKGKMHLAMEPSPEWSVSGVRTAATNQPSQKPRNLRRVATKIASTFAKKAQNANVEMHLAMEPSPEWSVSGVRTAATDQPSQKPRNLHRVATKIASTFAKQVQNAKVPTDCLC